MTILPEDLENLLEAERDIDVPAPAQRQRMFARLEPLLIVPVALTAGSSSVVTAADATGSSAVGGFLQGKVAVAVVSAALMGGAVGATGHAYFAAPVPPPTGVASVPPATRPPVASVAREPARPAPDATTAISSAASTPSQSGVRQERAPVAGSLRAERLLLEAASAALLRGDSESAILALRKHGQRFPNGALAEERRALLERALAASRKPR